MKERNRSPARSQTHRRACEGPWGLIHHNSAQTVQAHLRFFFFLAVSRPDSGNKGAQTTPHRMHTRALFLKGLTICWCASKVIPSLVMSLLNVPLDPVSSYFLFTCYITDDTCCLSYAVDWNQTKPVCSFARGWTAWPSGRSDPKTQVVSPSSSSMSAASTRRSTFRPET